jgi:hypothetical protein
MNDGGSCFVAQTTLAAAAALSKPTVNKAISLALESHWIGVTTQGSSHGWRRFIYRACIPDSVTVTQRKWVDMLEGHGADYGPVQTGKVVNVVDQLDTPDVVKPVYQDDAHDVVKQFDHDPAEFAKRSPERGKNGAPNVVKPVIERGKKSRDNVVKPLDPNSSLRTLDLSVLRKGPLAGSGTIGERPKRRTQKTRPTLTQERKLQQAIKAVKAGQADDAFLRRQYDHSLADVQRAMMANGADG